jgi:hypothetical protein
MRELLSVMLVVRAHVEVHGAQLERLNARVATLERLARVAGSSVGSAAARTRPMTLLDLPRDALVTMVTYLHRDDELAASLACRKLRDALRAVRSSVAQPPLRTLETRVRSLFGSLSKLRWGVASAGAPLSAALFARAAGLGDLRMLSWLSERGCAWHHGADAADREWLAANADRRQRRQLVGPCAEAAGGGHLSVLQWLH